jgi:hypothetical protein
LIIVFAVEENQKGNTKPHLLGQELVLEFSGFQMMKTSAILGVAILAYILHYVVIIFKTR